MRPARRRVKPKIIPVSPGWVPACAEREKSLTVIMVGHIMAMSMKRRVKVRLEPVRMAVFGNHFSMIGNNIEHRRGVACAGRKGPDNNRKAKKRHKRTSSVCSQGFHRFACLLVFSSRHVDRASLFYPLGEDNLFL
jgi:hypothetical protein